MEPEPKLNSDLDAFFGSVAVAEGAGADFAGDDDDFEPEPLDAEEALFPTAAVS